jgi:hypothetical protein
MNSASDGSLCHSLCREVFAGTDYLGSRMVCFTILYLKVDPSFFVYSAVLYLDFLVT